MTRAITFRNFATIGVLASCLCGCSSGQYKDPNDPAMVGILDPIILKNDLGQVSDSLLLRVGSRDITAKQYGDYMAEAANHYLGTQSILNVDPGKAWQYADVMRTARRWQSAQELLKIAVLFAKGSGDEDRRINDSLRLAQVDAMLGQVPQGIAVARETFNAKPVDCAPVLPSVLLEFTPAAKGKGHDLELARLLEDAITVHLRTRVDPNTGPGRDFLIALPHHVSDAFNEAALLYTSSGHPELAAAAMRRRASLAGQLGLPTLPSGRPRREDMVFPQGVQPFLPMRGPGGTEPRPGEPQFRGGPPMGIPHQGVPPTGMPPQAMRRPGPPSKGPAPSKNGADSLAGKPQK